MYGIILCDMMMHCDWVAFVVLYIFKIFRAIINKCLKYNIYLYEYIDLFKSFYELCVKRIFMRDQ